MDVLLEVDKCPVCQSQQRMSEIGAKDDAPKQFVAVIPKPIQGILTIDVVVAGLEICTNCGAVYARMIQRQPASVKIEGRPISGDGSK